MAAVAVGIAVAVVADRGVVAAAGYPPRIAYKTLARLVTVLRSLSKSPCSFLCYIVRSFFTSYIESGIDYLFNSLYENSCY